MNTVECKGLPAYAVDGLFLLKPFIRRVYNRLGRTYLFDIDFWHIHDDNPSLEDEPYVMDAYHAGNVSGHAFTKMVTDGTFSSSPVSW